MRLLKRLTLLALSLVLAIAAIATRNPAQAVEPDTALECSNVNCVPGASTCFFQWAVVCYQSPYGCVGAEYCDLS